MYSNSQVIQLASKSPRRREILEQIGVRYELVTTTIDESAKLGEQAEALVQRLAEEKAKAGFGLSPMAPTLGSDTLVVFEGQIFGKPKDENDCLRMLGLLSGRQHEVLTAVAVYDGETLASALSVSKVWFRELSDEQIRKYWQTEEPKDKAGAYAIQGKGAVFLNKMEGSYSGVMGLPIKETVKLLEQFKIDYWL